jgi:hypothetical protein
VAVCLLWTEESKTRKLRPRRSATNEAADC